jgi:hypothetical protein
MTPNSHLELVSPMAPAPPTTPVSGRRSAPAWTDFSGARVSVVENGKHNALELLEAMRSLLVTNYGAVPGITVHKEVSGPIYDQDLARLADASDLVLVGTAD